MNSKLKFTFKKAERLKSRKQIGLLFKNRQSIAVYPLRIFWADTEDAENEFPAKMAFSVSKKTFKQAVNRNRYKRLMKEIYRHHKHELYDNLTKETKSVNLMLLYVGKEEFDYSKLEKCYLRLIDKFLAKL
jgi:ribonuclease P protein component